MTIILFAGIILFLSGWIISFKLIIAGLILMLIFTLFNDEESDYLKWKEKYLN